MPVDPAQIFVAALCIIACNYAQEGICGHHNRWARRAFLLAAGAYAVVAARYALGAG